MKFFGEREVSRNKRCDVKLNILEKFIDVYIFRNK